MRNNKHVLITGATSGIGYELARIFAREGYNIVAVARSRGDLNLTASELESEFGILVYTFPKDLFEPDSAFELYEEVRARRLKIDVLVNNAGQGLYGEFVNTKLEKELDIIQLNISSMVVLTKLFLRDMVARGDGKILNLSSVASKAPGPWQSVYHGTKAFVQSFTEAIREEVKDKGVVVTALLPGATDTDFFRKAHMQSSKIVQDREDMADPADVAMDGYKALMDNKDMVVSGAGNKFQVMMSNLTPDSVLAQRYMKGQAPVEADQE